MHKTGLYLLFILALPFIGCTQEKMYSHLDSLGIDTASYADYDNKWFNLADGLDYIEMDAPRKSILNDSKISILKVNPNKVDFQMLSASQNDSMPLTADCWAETYDLNVVINAGMYDLRRKLSSKGFLQNGDYCNNPALYPGYNMMIAFNPTDTLKNNFKVLDLKCDDWHNVKKDFQCYAQGLRMIDCNGFPMNWKKPQSCSMLVVCSDDLGNIFYIFTRSPYTHNQMIHFMGSFPFRLSNAIYMEGGPQTSLFIKVGDRTIAKVGSYVSQTFPNDDNMEFWPLPNVIGVKVR